MQITIQEIKNMVLEALNETLACLGVPYPVDADVNGDNIRALAHKIKRGDDNAIKKAASILYKYVQPNSILIPIPSHSGRSTYTLKLAQLIAKKSGAKVLDIIYSDPRETLYDRKLGGVSVNNIDLGFHCSEDNDGSIVNLLKHASNVILVDNVVDSGITYEQAHNALLNAYGIDSWMLSLGVVEKSKHDVDDERVFRSLINDR